MTAIDIQPPAQLENDDVEILWQLYSPHHSTSRAQFEERIRNFDGIALFRERYRGRIVGFTGVRIREVDVMGRRRGTLYFGQTYIEHAFRGQQFIQRTVTWLMLTQRIRSPRIPWYFWSDALSYKPYLIMARNLEHFFPNPGQTTPPEIKQLVDQLGQIYYGATYDAASGVVRKVDRRLHDHVAPIGERELRDPFIRFYAERNPNHDRGHGLIIICPLSLENLITYLRRLGRRTLGKAR